MATDTDPPRISIAREGVLGQSAQVHL
jgi:hypothetical protein